MVINATSATRLPVVMALFLVLSPWPPAQETDENSFPAHVYWGDTHLHTSNSLDAGRYTILVGPEEAYRFARGEQVRSDEGADVKLTRPLDFLVVSDHSENIG